MRAVIVALALCLAGSALGAEPDAASETDIHRVITAQIEAFRHDDGDAALVFAAPAIRERLGDGTSFLALVKEHYTAIYRPHTLSFGPLIAGDGLWVQHVEVVGADGEASTAIYEMEHEADGAWRIAGCTLAKSGKLDL